MICPNCGRACDLDNVVYTNILDSDTHPAYMIYAPTCECSYKFKEKKYLVYGDGYNPNVIWFGGIKMIVGGIK